MLQYLIHQREWSLTLSLQRSRLNDKDHWVRIFFPLNLYFITLSVFSHDDWIVPSIERDFTNFQIFQKLHFVNSIIWRYLNHFNISHDGTFIWRRKNKHTRVHNAPCPPSGKGLLGPRWPCPPCAGPGRPGPVGTAACPSAQRRRWPCAGPTGGVGWGVAAMHVPAPCGAGVDGPETTHPTPGGDYGNGSAAPATRGAVLGKPCVSV